MIWKPHVTVAAVIEQDGRFLLVEEHTDEGLRFNQPAGHLEEGESLLAAVVRETLEESAHHFQPTALIGIYLWPHPHKDLTYLRVAFTGTVTGFDPQRPLDHGIVRALWQDAAELPAERLRSPLVAQCIADYQAGRRYPLDMLRDIAG